MRFLCFTVLLNALIWPLISNYLNKSSLLKVCTICFGLFLVVYTYIASALLYFDKFQVTYVLGIIFGIEGTLYLLIHPSLKTALNQIDFDLREHLELIILVGALSVVITLKSVPIAPLFDAGVYGSKTIDLINGDTTSIKTLKEYEIVDGTAREELIELQRTQGGLYRFSRDSDSTPVCYEYHGLPTWPSVMALSAKCGGLNNMSQILTFIYFLICFCLYFILENMGIKKISRLLSVLVFGGSPLILYLAKLPLSELYITSLTVFSLFLLTEKSNEIKLISGISLGAIGFAHLSLFMYMPAIFMGLLVLYILRREEVYGKINYIANAMLIFSLIYARKVTSLYTNGQLGKMFKNKFDSLSIIKGICLACCLFIIVQFMFYKSPKLQTVLKTLYVKHRRKIILCILVILGIFTLYQGYVLGFTSKLEVTNDSWRFRASYINQGFSSLKYLNIVNIMMATSYVALPIVIISMLKENKEEVDILKFILLYSLAIYTIIRCDTPINYLTSRYFVTMIIPLIVLLMGIAIRSVKKAIIVGMICIITSLPFNLLLAKTEEYYGNIQLLQDISIIVGKESIVLINPEDTFLSYQLTTNLREYNRNLVFNLHSIGNIKKIAGNTPVYALSMAELDDEGYEKVFEKTYRIIGDLYSLDVVYPLTVGTEDMLVHVYRIPTDGM